MTGRWKTSVNSEEERTGTSCISRGWRWSKWDLRGMEAHSPPPPTPAPGRRTSTREVDPWCETQMSWRASTRKGQKEVTRGDSKRATGSGEECRGKSDSLGLPSSSPSIEAACTFPYHPIIKMITLTCAESLACLQVGRSLSRVSVVSNSWRPNGL